MRVSDECARGTMSGEVPEDAYSYCFDLALDLLDARKQIAEQAEEIEGLIENNARSVDDLVKMNAVCNQERTAREKAEREIERLRGEVFALTDRLIRCLDVNERQGGVALELTDALTRETAEIKAREKAEARVKVLEELAAALDDLLCAYRVGGQEWGARAADRVSRAREAFRAEKGGEDE